MKTTAVVVTYNRISLLEQGIECLKSQQGLDEIIVVNNGATDGTREWLNQTAGLTVIHQTNVGGSGGFYTGIKRAYDTGADWIWCMDDDVFARPGCLERLTKCAKHIGKPCILMPRRTLQGKTFTHEFTRFNFSNPLASMHGGKLKGTDFDNLPEENTPKTREKALVPISGCDFEGPFIAREIVEKIGLPNKELFIFCDDTDYCLRAAAAGFPLFYAPYAEMKKHLFFTDDTWSERNRKKKWKRFYQIRNETYLNHHYGKNLGVRYGRGFIGLMGYITVALATMPFSKAWQWQDLKMLVKAYRDGINERLGKRNE